MLELSELHNHSFEQQIAGEFGNGVHKQIICKTTIYADFPPEVEFTVKDNNVIKLVTRQLDFAVESYNLIK